MIRASRPAAKRMSLARFKEMLREQYLLVRLDEERAVDCPAAIAGRAMTPSARRRSMSCIGSLLRVATCRTRAGVVWRVSKRCSARVPAEGRQGGGGTCLTLRNDPRRLAHEKYERLIKAAQAEATIKVAVAHPCDDVSLEGAVEAARLRLIEPILVGPEERIRDCRDARRSGYLRHGDREVGTQRRIPRRRRWNW